jgi:hypothetical protein
MTAEEAERFNLGNERDCWMVLGTAFMFWPVFLVTFLFMSFGLLICKLFFKHKYEEILYVAQH